MAKVFICRGPFCWGRADTPREALRLAKRNARLLPDPGEACFTVDMCDPLTEVTDMGGLTYPDTAPPIRIGFYDVNGRVPVKVDIL